MRTLYAPDFSGAMPFIEAFDKAGKQIADAIGAEYIRDDSVGGNPNKLYVGEYGQCQTPWVLVIWRGEFENETYLAAVAPGEYIELVNGMPIVSSAE